MMERQLGQMVRLVDDLLDISRISRGKLELRKARVDLWAVVQSAVETARPLIEAQRPRADRHAAAAAGLPGRRPDPAGPGVLEPAEQQRQVHGAGRAHLPDRRACKAARRSSRVRDNGHRHPRRDAARACSRCSRRWTGAWSGRRAGWASGWRW